LEAVQDGVQLIPNNIRRGAQKDSAKSLKFGLNMNQLHKMKIMVQLFCP